MRAIKDINFLPDYVLQRQHNARRSVAIISGIIVFAFVAFGLYLLPIQVHKYFTVERDDYKVKLSKLSDVQQMVNDFEEMRSTKDKKKTIMAKIKSKQVMIVENIDQINSIIPAGVKLKSCNISGKEFNINFIINTPLDVIDLLEGLENLKLYKKVMISSSPIIDGTNTVNIKLELK